MRRFRFTQLVEDLLGIAPGFDHTGFPQDAQLLGKRRLANIQLDLKLADGKFPCASVQASISRAG